MESGYKKVVLPMYLVCESCCETNLNFVPPVPVLRRQHGNTAIIPAPDIVDAHIGVSCDGCGCPFNADSIRCPMNARAKTSYWLE